MSITGVVIIFGAGKRVGASVAAKFASIGYKVALVSRSGTGTINEEGYLSLKADFTDPRSVAPAFDAAETEFGTPPNVVVYNAGALSFPTDKTSVLSVPADKIASDLNINTVSAYVAAQEAVKRWETLPAATKKTFIYTGNASNEILVPSPLWLTLGMGKSASAFWVGLSDKLYEAKGYRWVVFLLQRDLALTQPSRFFYADERREDGTVKGNIDGPYHGEFFAHLATHEEKLPWQATFVKDKGYVHFDPKSVSVDKIMEMVKPMLDAWLKN
ncbi:hypothetical protein SLS60_003117 [Paraconiothyrium brasiliense]|uniref:NAD(P)-binding protein n=1 Tax=Paraconiothyrium brasiliense TaxID=300254 RepID=A0ABR3RV73_9PLEO